MSIEQRLLELADETLRDARWKTEIRKIAEEVRIIETRMKRLEKAGDKMADMMILSARIIERESPSALAWLRAKEDKL